MLELKINSPATVTEGTAYPVRLTITNKSTKAGLPVEAALVIGISAATPSATLITKREMTEVFAAGETRAFEFPMSVPMGTGGEVGNISAWVLCPFGDVIDSAVEDLVIAHAHGDAYPTSATPDRSTIYAGETFYITVGVRVEKASIYGAKLDGITGNWSRYHNACRFDGTEVTHGQGLGIGTLAPGSYTFRVPVTISRGVWAPGYVYEKCMIARLMYGDRPGLPGLNSVASFGSPIIITFYT